MAATQSLPVVRLRLACADEAEFQRKYAAYISKNGVFVPATAPPAVGASVAIEIALTDGSVGVRGEAVVVRHGKVRDTAGMTLRLNRLAPDSFQFPLESVLPPAAGPATPAAATTPGLDLDIQLAT